MKGKIIAVIGAPRSGKSFLVQKLAQRLGYRPFMEEGVGLPKYLEKDIQNNTNGLRRIVWFRNAQVTHFLDAVDLTHQGENILLDTFWVDNQMYIDVLLEGNDKKVAERLSQIDARLLPWPDVIVYLKNGKENTERFVSLGGRSYDASIYETTILPLQAKYERIFSLVPSTTKLVSLDRGDIDFEREADLENLVKLIEG